MYAITVTEPGGPEAMSWAEVAEVEPGPGELRIEVVGAGVNRADLMQRQGHYPPPPGASAILGLECSGHVDALGPGVTDWSIGDPCVALLAGGGYAEHVVVPAGQVLPPPAGVDLATAAGLIEVAATVVSNLDLAGLTDGDTLLVHGGAGGIGSFAISYAAALGATVLATAGTERKRAYCRELGAAHAVDYHEDWPQQVLDVTGGVGAHVILDNMGASYLPDNLRCLAPDGRLMIIGLQGGRRAELDLGALLSRRGAVFATGLRGRPVDDKAAICRRVADRVWPWYADGTLRPTTTRTFAMADAADAHRLLESGESHGKIVLVR